MLNDLPGAAPPVLAILAACAQQPGSTPATQNRVLAASTPGWRVTELLPNLTVGGLWAGGARDAWLAGDACADPATCGGATRATAPSWCGTGTAGRGGRSSRPEAYINTPLDQGAGLVTGTSAANVWVAAYRGTESADWTDMLHWTGSRWAAPVRLPSPIQAVVAPSATQLWAFGDGTKPQQPGYVAHFTGQDLDIRRIPPVRYGRRGAFSRRRLGRRHHRRGPCPAWSTGMDATWQATPLPDIWPDAALFGVDVQGIAAVKADDVWADVSDLGSSFSNRQGRFSCTGTAGPGPGPGSPTPGSAYSPVTTDGHGGLWLVLAGKARRRGSATTARAAGPGRPCRVRPLPQLLARIPGTNSQWAAGNADGFDVGTAILKYGT